MSYSVDLNNPLDYTIVQYCNLMDYVPPKLIKITTVSNNLVIMTIFDMTKVTLTFAHLFDPCTLNKIRDQNKNQVLRSEY